MLILLAALSPASPAATARADGPIRILIVGDSVAQGSAGDWTWRYRLWEHYRAQGVVVDFLGPRHDLFDNVARELGSQAYLDPAFDTDHAARWGMSFTDQDQPVGDLVAEFRPDVVVEMLGVNDLAWQDTGAEGLHDRIVHFIGEARAADPDVDVVVGRVAQTWLKDVPAANSRISDLPGELGTPDSRVAVAATDTGFRRRADTWDWAHPDAAGEVKLAAAVADALAGIGWGAPYPRPLLDVPLGPRWAPTVSAVAGNGRVRLTWTGSPGSDHEYVWSRDVSARKAWQRLPGPRPGHRSTVDGLVNGHAYAFRLQPVKGYHAAEPDVRSDVVRATPMAPPPGPVSHLSASPSRHTLALTWGRARHATGYVVRWWPSGRPGAAHRLVVTATRARVRGLVAGHRYVATVIGLNATTPGPVRRVSVRTR